MSGDNEKDERDWLAACGDEFDWRGCNAVQWDAMKLHGRGNVDGTRMFADGVLDNYDDGMTAEDIADSYDLDIGPVREIIAFATAKRLKEG